MEKLVKAEPGFEPTRAHDDDACADLRACIELPLTLAPGERATVGTGVRIQYPAGYHGEVCPRSGLAARHGITVLNAPGIVDAGYTGEIRVVLHNAGTQLYTVSPRERIAQLMDAMDVNLGYSAVDEFPESERGESGFGSTGAV